MKTHNNQQFLKPLTPKQIQFLKAIQSGCKTIKSITLYLGVSDRQYRYIARELASRGIIDRDTLSINQEYIKQISTKSKDAEVYTLHNKLHKTDSEISPPKIIQAKPSQETSGTELPVPTAQAEYSGISSATDYYKCAKVLCNKLSLERPEYVSELADYLKQLNLVGLTEFTIQQTVHEVQKSILLRKKQGIIIKYPLRWIGGICRKLHENNAILASLENNAYQHQQDQFPQQDFSYTFKDSAQEVPVYEVDKPQSVTESFEFNGKSYTKNDVIQTLLVHFHTNGVRLIPADMPEKFNRAFKMLHDHFQVTIPEILEAWDHKTANPTSARYFSIKICASPYNGLIQLLNEYSYAKSNQESQESLQLQKVVTTTNTYTQDLNNKYNVFYQMYKRNG